MLPIDLASLIVLIWELELSVTMPRGWEADVIEGEHL